MRRKERLVTDPDALIDIIRKCNCLRLGLIDNNIPYIVPLNFGFEFTKNGFIFYIHGALEGKKVDLIKNTTIVGFELDYLKQIVDADQACNFTCHYQSIIGSGKITILEHKDEKRHGLQQLMNQYSNQSWDFPVEMLKNTFVCKIDVHEITGKQNLG